MSTLVTGGFGCIGSWVVRGLLAAGERPVVYDLGDDPWRLRMIAGDDVAERATLVRGDIADRDALIAVVREHAIRTIIRRRQGSSPRSYTTGASPAASSRFTAHEPMQPKAPVTRIPISKSVLRDTECSTAGQNGLVAGTASG